MPWGRYPETGNQHSFDGAKMLTYKFFTPLKFQESLTNIFLKFDSLFLSVSKKSIFLHWHLENKIGEVEFEQSKLLFLLSIRRWKAKASFLNKYTGEFLFPQLRAKAYCQAAVWDNRDSEGGQAPISSEDKTSRVRLSGICHVVSVL